MSVLPILLSLALSTGAPADDQLDALSAEGDLEALFSYLETEHNEITVVSSAGVEQSIREAPSIISVITREQIRDRGYQSIAEALRVLPGFHIVDDNLLPNVTVRGVFGDLRGWGRFIKVMVDGQSIAYRTGNTNYLGIGTIPLSIVERIEVIRGPGSALYGANAFLGVVNIITRKPGELVEDVSVRTRGMLTEVNAGVEGEVFGSYSYKGFDAIVAFSGVYADRSGLEIERTYESQSADTIPLNDPSRNDINRSRSGFVKLSYDAGNAGLFTIDGLLQNLDNHGEFQDHSVLSHKNRYSTGHGHARLRWAKSLEYIPLDLRAEATYVAGRSFPNERLQWTKDDSYIRRRLDFRGGEAAFEGTLRFRERDSIKLGVDTSIVNQANPSAIEVLTEARGDLLPGDENKLAPFRRTTFSNVGFYLQGQTELTSWLSLTGGFRGDYHNIFGFFPSGRAAAVLRPLDALSIKLLFGTSIMAPAADQLFAELDVGSDGINGNPDLKMQHARTYELGVDYQFDELFTARVAGFVTQVYDKVEFRQNGRLRRPVNFDDITTGGAEAELALNLDRVDATLGVAMIFSSRGQSDLIGIPDPADELLTGAPMTTLSADVGVNIPEAYMRALLEFRYHSSVQPTRENFVRSNRDEDYRLGAGVFVDLVLSTKGLNFWFAPEDSLRVMARVTNLLNQRPFQPGFNGIDVPSLGRTYNLEVTVAY